MDRFLKIAELRDLENQVAKEEISYSRMVEIINYKAQKYYNEKYKLISIKEYKPSKTAFHEDNCICYSCNLLSRIYTHKNKKQ